MAGDFEDKKQRNYINRRSIMDYGMGLIIGGFGLFFALSDQLGITFYVDPVLKYGFAGLCILYGAFRIYRGYKKNYFRS